MSDPMSYEVVPILSDPCFDEPDNTVPLSTRICISPEIVERWRRAEERIGRPLRGFGEILGAALNEDWSP